VNEGPFTLDTGKFRRLSPQLRAMAEVLRNPDLRRLELALVGFHLAEWATWVAILVFAFDVGGTAAVGLVALIQLVPAAILAPFAAIVGDRFPRRRVLALGYLVQAGAMVATAAALFTSAPIAVTYALAAVTMTSITLTRPVHNALLPMLARVPEELTAANVASTTVEGFGILAGPALAGAILSVAGPGVVFTVSAATVLVSAGLATRIDGGASLAPSGKAPGDLLSEAARGFRELASKPDSRLIVVLAGILYIVWGALDVLLVALAFEVLMTGEPGVGYLNSAMGAGGLIGAAVTLSLVGRRRLVPALAVGILAWGAAIALTGVIVSPMAALTFMAVAGVGRSFMHVSGRTLLQRLVPDEVLSRVFGVEEGLMMAGVAVGAIVASGVVALVGVRGGMAVAGLLLPLVALARVRRLARMDATATVRVEQVELLQGIPMFEPLFPPVLERLASQLVAVPVRAGTTVIREGDAGDRFYVVSRGELEVSVGRRVRARLHPGDSFGEIALLRRVPRTATVSAVGDALLYALDRRDFLQAVTGSRQSSEVAEAVIASRLPPPLEEESGSS
jgi:MFS family permease